MILMPEQSELSRHLPVVVGNVDYEEYEQILRQVDELLRVSGQEARFVEQALGQWLRARKEEARKNGLRYRPPGAKERLRQQQIFRTALRCTVARHLTEKEYRKFTRRLAESALLQWFCGIAKIDQVRVPSKSSLHRYEKLVSEEDIRVLVNDLNRLAGTGATVDEPQPLGLDTPTGPEICLVDTTCVKANIHFPVDWVLLRDAVRTLMKATMLIRREGLKHRMEEPEVFLRRMNRLSMQMTHARRKAGSVKERKRVLREMKKLSKVIARHARRYVVLLQEQREQTSWTQPQAQQVLDRMQNVLDQLPAATRQAHERLIGGRQVKNKEKILSLYERDIHVIVRGKASAEVEFGNTLYVAEQNEGLIVDWKLLKDRSPGDPTLLEESLDRMHEVFDLYPIGVGADRGFSRKATVTRLDKDEIYDGICPRSPQDLQQRLKEEAFEILQRRRSQTEGRLGILKNDFLGRPLRSKGFPARELAVAWAVLAHNLWVLARRLMAEEEQRRKAA